jgi:hypothetical protein
MISHFQQKYRNLLYKRTGAVVTASKALSEKLPVSQLSQLSIPNSKAISITTTDHSFL